MSELETLVRAVIEAYPEDATKPSVILSYVNAGYYGSIVRYDARGNRNVVCYVTGWLSLEVAVRQLADIWLRATETPVTFRDKLRAVVGR